MALGNPIEAFLQAAREKKDNQQQMFQNIAGMGQGIGQMGQSIGEMVAQERKKKMLQQLVSAIRNQGAPQQGPQLPGVGAAGTPSPMSGMGAPPQNNSSQIMSIMAQLDPDSVIKNMMPPNALQQSEISKNNALASKYAKGGSPSSYLSNLTWDTATPEQQNLAKALVDGNIRPSDLSFRDRGQAVMLANEYARKQGIPFQSFRGDVNAGMGKNLAFGKMGQNALSLNTALGHAGTAYEAFQAIGNTDETWLNKPINYLKKNTNDPNVVKLGISLNALRGELATTFKGSGGTDQEIGAWKDYLNENLTPLQASAAIQQVDDLLRSRLSALEYQQKDVTGNTPSQRTLLSPHGAALSKKFQGIGKTNVKSFNSVEEAEAAHLPKGTKVTINGRSATIQ